MERSQDQFGGITPRLSSRLLPATLGQTAINARLLSGNLEAWHQFGGVKTLALPAPVQSIYKLNGAWLEWHAGADVARGPVPGDTTFRVFITNPTLYSTPVWTDYAKATDGAEPYPVVVQPLGVPAPTAVPQFTGTVTVSGFDQTEETDYVYTFVNTIGEESAPSPSWVQTAGIPIPFAPTGNGDYNSIALFFSVSSGIDDFHIASVRLYRAATGATGTVFRFVAEIALSSFTNLGSGHFDYIYADSIPDTGLGEVLATTNWDMPPADMKGIIALPNGVMAGFVGNLLCLSVPNHPHAWPVDYQLTTDTDIVAIENIDTSIVVTTKSFPYIALGTDPSQYSMTKFEFSQAVTSKRSIVLLRGIGVVAATSLGLIAFQGVGQLTNLTERFFTYDQWQDLNPSSILGVVYNNIYFLFYDNGVTKGGYALDFNPTGSGVTQLSFHATAAYNDPEQDSLYLVLDTVAEPTDPNLPLGSTAPSPNGHTIYRFNDPNGSGGLVYKYRGRLNLLDRPACFGFARVRAAAFTNLVLNLYADGALLYGAGIQNDFSFTLPMTDEYNTLEWELVGTSPVYSIQVAEDISELRLVPQIAPPAGG